MKKGLAILITVLLIAGAILFSYRQRKSDPEEPETVIWRMLEHSRTGDVQAYLDSFSASTRAQLEATAREMTFAGFSDYLKESSARVKGVAVYEVRRMGEDRATLVVEYVYKDRNERQRLGLKRQGGRWCIEWEETSQRVQPLVPYGKPATDVQ